MYTLITTPKYYQGKDVLNNLGDYIKYLGDKVFILSGNTAYDFKKEDISKSLDENNIEFHFERFNGEITKEEIERVGNEAKSYGANLMIGLGGGKVVDTAKTAADDLNLPFVSAPTIASTDAPCSAVAVIYDDNGNVVDLRSFKRNPDLVIVDTQMVADAPTYQLIAGMGDALATYFEARVCYENKLTNLQGDIPSETGFRIGEICYNTLIKYGELAVLACDENIVTDALEKIGEANTYLSGTGFENGGISCAHSIQDALTMIPECHEYSHGHRVAFGTLALLVLEDRPIEEIFEVMDFSYSVGLPITLEDLGLVENLTEEIRRVAPFAYFENGEGAYRMPPGTTVDKIANAIIIADKLGHQFKNSIY